MRKLGSIESKGFNKFWIKNRERIMPISIIGILVFLWQVFTQLYRMPKYILPSPIDIGKALNGSKELLWMHTLQTIYEAGVGFGIAIVFALGVAIIMNQWKLLGKSLYPILVISQTVPIIALAPLIMIWMGFGSIPKIVIVIIVCFFPISVSVVEGLSTVDKDLVDIMKVMGASKWQIFTKVEMPSTMPAFFAGLKIAATYSIMGAVIGEWLGASRGLGIFMTRAMSSFRTADLFAAILIIVILSIGIFQLVEFAGKKTMPWNKE